MVHPKSVSIKWLLTLGNARAELGLRGVIVPVAFAAGFLALVAEGFDFVAFHMSDSKHGLVLLFSAI
jgi:hypothetical protein